MNAELINIGTELLLGLVTNTHAVYLGRKLADLGFVLKRQLTVGDVSCEIAGAVSESLSRADLVITTGGLGPTSDDITVASIAKMFDLKLCMDEKVQRLNEAIFKKRGIPMPELVELQARVPEEAQVLYNQHGTAPGLILRVNKKMIVVLPGPPRELRPMFENEVVPVLQQEFADHKKLEIRILRIADMGESVVQERVEKKLREKFPDVEVAYSARPGEVDLRLMSGRPGQAEEASRFTRGILGDAVFADGEKELEEVVIALLRERKKTVATAESCTGGALANRFTNVAGSSEVYRQGWVTYANESKEHELGVKPETIRKHGAVSEEAAREMAEGARKESGADFALSVTGIAGPDGGTKEKPAGTVFIGLASAGGTQVYKEFYPLDRWTFKWRVAQRALNLLRLNLLG